MNTLLIERTQGSRSVRSKKVRAVAVLPNNVAATIFPTQLGWMAIAGQSGALVGVDFGHASQERAEKVLAARCSRINGNSSWSDAPKWLRDVATLLERFAAGEAVDFCDVCIDVEHLTPFARRVVADCRNIPRGESRTYGNLAAECGSPGAARAVGSVMAKNRCPIVVPCHRVVGAAGSLGGYSAPEGLSMKRRLLAMERLTAGVKNST
jgi:methylated-DNA-[protein]-cysteine S-methyltransferase